MLFVQLFRHLSRLVFRPLERWKEAAAEITRRARSQHICVKWIIRSNHNTCDACAPNEKLTQLQCFRWINRLMRWMSCRGLFCSCSSPLGYMRPFEWWSSWEQNVKRICSGQSCVSPREHLLVALFFRSLGWVGKSITRRDDLQECDYFRHSLGRYTMQTELSNNFPIKIAESTSAQFL